MADYSDIIDRKHPVSLRHAQMPRQDRAAQFSPFAALTGLDSAMEETARLTDTRPELDDMEKEKLDARLRLLNSRIAELPDVELSWFEADSKKAGGAVMTAQCRVKKIDTIKSVLVLSDGRELMIGDVLGIEGELFDELDAYMC